MKGISRGQHLYSKLQKLWGGNSFKFALSKLENIFLCHWLSYAFCPRSWRRTVQEACSVLSIHHCSAKSGNDLFKNAIASHFSRWAGSLQILILISTSVASVRFSLNTIFQMAGLLFFSACPLNIGIMLSFILDFLILLPLVSPVGMSSSNLQN